MEGVNNTNPLQQWIKDIHAEIKQWKKDSKVILMADTNSPLGSDDIGEFLPETESIDLIGNRHGISNINSHIRDTQ
eukprot:15352789-Ditylum_brightwellii.AAC.1